MRFASKKHTTLLTGAILFITSISVFGEELKPGFIIDKSNLSSLDDATFEGTPVKDMIPEKTQWLITDHNLRIKLAASKPMPVVKKPLELAKKYDNENTVSLNENGHLINWTAGMPFPNVNLTAPDAASKLMWNFYVGGDASSFDFLNLEKFAFVFIDGKSGIEREQIWALQYYKMWGRTWSDEPIIGDSKLLNRKLLFATYPDDVRGVGTFINEYVDERPDEAWAYIRSFRRIRRISGNSWSEPIPGTDLLQEDDIGFQTKPSNYASWKLLGKKKILLPIHPDMELFTWKPDAGSQKNEYPAMDLSAAPYWHPNPDFVVWQPRETYIIEGVPPSYHPYGRRIIYMDAATHTIPMGEIYDKRNEYWKGSMHPVMVYADPAMDLNLAFPSLGIIADYKRMHATNYVTGKPDYKMMNTPGINGDHINVEVLRKGEPVRPQ